MVKRLGRLVLVVLIGVAGAALLVSVVGAMQLGSSESREVVLKILDEKHIAGPKTHWWRAARHLERVDSSRDARRAVRAGDSRLLAMATIGPYLPGLDDHQYESYASRYGTRFLAEGCVISSDEEMRYRDAAYRYAAGYNEYIVSEVRK